MSRTENLTEEMNSAIYEGWVRHRRFSPSHNDFCYPVFMLYLDLSELEEVFRGTPLWSSKRKTLAYFNRGDYLGDPEVPLDKAVRRRVQEEVGHCPEGKICLLTNLRYFGYLINPISCYYVFDNSDRLAYIVAEVTNTPWGEKRSYVLSCDPTKHKQRISFQKSLHVSPFNPMDLHYQWFNNTPCEKLWLHIQTWRQDTMNFDASVSLKRKPITTASLNKTIMAYPFMTAKIFIWIYWQALKLWFKHTPLYDHPKQTKIQQKKVAESEKYQKQEAEVL